MCMYLHALTLSQTSRRKEKREGNLVYFGLLTLCNYSLFVCFISLHTSLSYHREKSTAIIKAAFEIPQILMQLLALAVVSGNCAYCMCYFFGMVVACGFILLKYELSDFKDAKK